MLQREASGKASPGVRTPPAPLAHRAIVTAQLLLVPEAQVQPVARHVQVLRAEAGTAAEASPSGRRHGKAAGPPAVRQLPGESPPRARRRQPRGRCKFSTAERNADRAGTGLEGGFPGEAAMFPHRTHGVQDSESLF